MRIIQHALPLFVAAQFSVLLYWLQTVSTRS